MSLLDQFIQNIKSSKHLVRKFSIASLQKLSLHQTNFLITFPLVVEALRDPNWEVRNTAIETLNFLIHQYMDNEVNPSFHQNFVKQISEFLSHKEPDLRAKAIHILTILTCKDKDQSSLQLSSLVSKLTSMLEDPHPKVQEATIKGMAVLATHHIPLRSAVDNILQFLITKEQEYSSIDSSNLAQKCLPNFLEKLSPCFEKIFCSSQSKGGQIDCFKGLNQLLDDPDQDTGIYILKWIKKIYIITLPLDLRIDLVKKLIYLGIHTSFSPMEEMVKHTLYLIFQKEGQKSPLSLYFFLQADEEESLLKMALSPFYEMEVSMWASKTLGFILQNILLPQNFLEYLQKNLQEIKDPILSLLLIQKIGENNQQVGSFFYQKILEKSLEHNQEKIRKIGIQTLGIIKVNAIEKIKIFTILVELLSPEKNESIQIVMARAIEKMSFQVAHLRTIVLEPLLHLALNPNLSYSHTYAEVLGVLLQNQNGLPQNGMTLLQNSLLNKNIVVKENALWLLTMVGKYYPETDLSLTLINLQKMFQQTSSSFLRREILYTLLEFIKHPSLKDQIPQILNFFILALTDEHPLVSEVASLLLHNIFKDFDHDSGSL